MTGDYDDAKGLGFSQTGTRRARRKLDDGDPGDPVAIILGALSLGNGFHFTINLTINEQPQGIWYYFPHGFWWSLYSLIVFFYWRSGGSWACTHILSICSARMIPVWKISFQYFSIFGRALLLRLYMWLLIFFVVIIAGDPRNHCCLPLLNGALSDGARTASLTATEAVNLFQTDDLWS